MVSDASLRRRSRRVTPRHVAAAALALFLLPATASAQDEAAKESARQLGREGVRRYEAGDFDGARQLFHQAYRLVPAPTLALREARALVKLNRLVEGAEAYARAVGAPMTATSPEPFRQAAAAARVELDALRPRIPRLLITVEGVDRSAAGLSVRLDGVDVPPAFLGVERAVNPGTYHVQATLAGAGAPVSESVVLKESEQRSVVLRLRPAPGVAHRVPPTKPRDEPADGPHVGRTMGWVALGVGAAGLTVGVTTGLMALDRKSTLEDLCPQNRCPPSAQSDLDAFRALRTVSAIGYVAGLVGTGAGATLLLTSTGPGHRTEARVRPWIGLGKAGVKGEF